MRPKSTNIQIPILLARTLIPASLSSGLGAGGGSSDPGQGCARLVTAQVPGPLAWRLIYLLAHQTNKLR